METNGKYGLDPQCPIMLRSVGESHVNMMALPCRDGFNKVFHRRGSKSGIHAKPMDTYEVMTADFKRRDIYVYCYATESHWRSPMGFLFDPLATVGYKVEQSCRFLDDIDEGCVRIPIWTFPFAKHWSFWTCLEFSNLPHRTSYRGRKV